MRLVNRMNSIQKTSHRATQLSPPDGKYSYTISGYLFPEFPASVFIPEHSTAAGGHSKH